MRKVLLLIKSRFRNFFDAVRQVKQNPLLHKYKKTLPEDYKAVHVLSRYVAFFKLYHLKSGNVIFFVMASDLFTSMLREVDTTRIRLNFTLRKTHDDYSSISKLLHAHGFALEAEDDSEEVWKRAPRGPTR